MTQIQKDRLKYILGLRGFAALAILIGHIGTPFSSWIPVLNSLYGYGIGAVVAFFIISSFSITYGFIRKNSVRLKSYYLRRFIRIAPVFYLVLIYAFMTTVSPWKYPGTPRYDFTDLFFHVIFMNFGEINFRYQNSIISGEWFITILMFYYLLLPLFYSFLRNGLKTAILYFSSFLLFINQWIYLLYGNPENSVGFTWSLQKFFYPIVLGSILAAILYDASFMKKYRTGVLLCGVGTALSTALYYGIHNSFSTAVLIAVFLINVYWKGYFSNLVSIAELILMIAASYVFITAKHSNPPLFMSLLTILTLQIASGRSIIVQWLFENRYIRYLGTISYSFYLLQMPVILTIDRILPSLAGKLDSGRWVIIFTALIIISSLVYFLVEKRLTEFLIRKLRI